MQHVFALLAAAAASAVPPLADGGVSPILTHETAPTWTLAGACSAFLLALAWALRIVLQGARDAAQRLYVSVIEPFARAQIGLMDALKSVQVSNAASLASLAESTDAIREEIHDLRKQVQSQQGGA